MSGDSLAELPIFDRDREP